MEMLQLAWYHLHLHIPAFWHSRGRMSARHCPTDRYTPLFHGLPFPIPPQLASVLPSIHSIPVPGTSLPPPPDDHRMLDYQSDLWGRFPEWTVVNRHPLPRTVHIPYL